MDDELTWTVDGFARIDRALAGHPGEMVHFDRPRELVTVIRQFLLDAAASRSSYSRSMIVPVPSPPPQHIAIRP
jgi:hypothetical protein